MQYFSTLERLRFAQESGLVDGISQHYDDIAKGFRRRKARQDRSNSEQIVRHIRRGSVIESHFSGSNSSDPYTTRSDTTQETELSREKQVLLARRLRASVILDAADEAVYKLNRQASRRNLTTGVDSLPSPLSPVRHSMDSHRGLRGPVDQADDTRVPQSFIDSFRWLDEEEDLDLRLFLDDYHAGLREGMPAAKQRPSFRRHLSISKIPFGRTSLSSISRPATKDANTSPISPNYYPPASGSSSPVSHSRRKSRTLSLITPKHAPQQSITAIDPAAAHYQDPEARLKLRVYLASPQKFDEAVEFGFPAADVLSRGTTPESDGDVATRRQSRQKPADDPSNLQSFLADEDEDENISLNSDPDSLADPESPKTPESFENRAGGLRPARFASPDIAQHARVRTPEVGNYAQAPVSSREMTLRMTLTRPDLRAHEDEIYGWQQRQQQQSYQQHARRPTGGASGSVPLAEGGRTVGSREGVTPKESMDWSKFDGVDHWNPNGTEKGVMKRIWNRMRRN